MKNPYRWWLSLPTAWHALGVLVALVGALSALATLVLGAGSWPWSAAVWIMLVSAASGTVGYFVARALFR